MLEASMNNKPVFRFRRRRPEKDESTWPPWIGSPTAWLALCLSSATAFYSFFYHSDELSVVATTYNSPVSSSVNLNPSLEISAEAPTTFTLVNSGSRPVALLSAQMVYVQPSRKTAQPNCQKGYIRTENLRLEETIVKPYDTVVKSTSFLKPTSQNTRSFPLSAANKALEHDRILFVCARFEFVTSDGVLRHKAIQLGRVILNINSASYGSRNRDPQYLIKRNRFWTEVGDDWYVTNED
jgi:hypothetical protein